MILADKIGIFIHRGVVSSYMYADSLQFGLLSYLDANKPQFVNFKKDFKISANENSFTKIPYNDIIKSPPSNFLLVQPGDDRIFFCPYKSRQIHIGTLDDVFDYVDAGIISEKRIQSVIFEMVNKIAEDF